MEDRDHLGFPPAFEPEKQHAGLNRDGAQGEEIIAGEGRIPGIEEMRAEQQCQHQRAEQAGPALLEPEQQEFVEPALRAGRGLERFEAGADASEARGVHRGLSPRSGRRRAFVRAQGRRLPGMASEPRRCVLAIMAWPPPFFLSVPLLGCIGGTGKRRVTLPFRSIGHAHDDPSNFFNCNLTKVRSVVRGSMIHAARARGRSDKIGADRRGRQRL